MIQSAQVNTAAIKTVAEAGTAVDPAAPGSDRSSGPSGGAIAGAVVGAVAGAAIIAAVTLFIIKRRRDGHHTSPTVHNSPGISTSVSGAVHFDPAQAAPQPAGAAAAVPAISRGPVASARSIAGVAGPNSARSVGTTALSLRDVDIEKGAGAGGSSADPDRSPPTPQQWPSAVPAMLQSPSEGRTPSGRINVVHPVPIVESRSRSTSAGSAAASPRSPAVGVRQGWGPAA
ncbi:hypothetical protein HXX76_007440 [Chlamydomonas incerta]|nr:hypothetical protein HXX76_007440 [Chlamydomonas incerta]|eukprot:KAG2435368.1 hypothetical protein HXX76_007440 [Chlamydomonas incerta]